MIGRPFIAILILLGAGGLSAASFPDAADAAPGGSRVPASLDDDMLLVGHSLVNHEMPHMISEMVASQGGTGAVRPQIINGGTLWNNWDNAGVHGEGLNVREVLKAGETEILMITEAIPLLGHIEYSRTYDHALLWYELAVDSNPDARVYLYETWPAFGIPPDVPTWRAMIDERLPDWEGVADHVNANRGDGPEMFIAPMGQAFARMHDEIVLGNVPGVDSILDLFLSPRRNGTATSSIRAGTRETTSSPASCTRRPIAAARSGSRTGCPTAGGGPGPLSLPPWLSRCRRSLGTSCAVIPGRA
jgi:hypothetical protein